MKKRIKKILAIFFLSAAVMVIIAGLLVFNHIAQPPAGEGEAHIIIKTGQNLRQIAQLLEDEGVVRNAPYFCWLAKRRGLAKNIRAGEYMLPRNLYPAQVLDRLVQGHIVYRKFTVPEGKTIAEIAIIVEKTGIASAAEFIEAASNTAGMEYWLAPGAKNLEGLLFPETYSYSMETTAVDVVKMMTGQFQRVFTSLWEEKTRGLSPLSITLTPREVVILASMVEKETGLVEEAPIVAGVFLNRIKINMRLMSDPTVIYGIPNFNGNLTRADLETPTPYNTYTQPGLPTGPICNPGAVSIKAVLHPANTEALYFVAKGDGSHQFSKTLDEHNAAVQRYQRGGR